MSEGWSTLWDERKVGSLPSASRHFSTKEKQHFTSVILVCLVINPLLWTEFMTLTQPSILQAVFVPFIFAELDRAVAN